MTSNTHTACSQHSVLFLCLLCSLIPAHNSLSTHTLLQVQFGSGPGQRGL